MQKSESITLSKGERLELALKIKGIKKTELADRMGRSKQHVNNWCKYSAFSLSTLEKILEKIDMTMAAFWNIQEPKK